jgi:hypothetical protein
MRAILWEGLTPEASQAVIPSLTRLTTRLANWHTLLAWRHPLPAKLCQGQRMYRLAHSTAQACNPQTSHHSLMLGHCLQAMLQLAATKVQASKAQGQTR